MTADLNLNKKYLQEENNQETEFDCQKCRTLCQMHIHPYNTSTVTLFSKIILDVSSRASLILWIFFSWIYEEQNIHTNNNNNDNNDNATAYHSIFRTHRLQLWNSIGSNNIIFTYEAWSKIGSHTSLHQNCKSKILDN